MSKKTEQLDDKWKVEPGGWVMQQCVFCKHKWPGQLCKAFPQGIPRDIIDNRFDHHYPHSDDNGVQFEEHAVRKMPTNHPFYPKESKP